MSTLDIQARAELAEAVVKIFEKGFDDWTQMFGFEAVTTKPLVRVLKSSEDLLRRIIANSVLVTTRGDGPVSGWTLFVFPNELIASAIAAAMMLPGEGFTLDEANEQQVEAAQELMNLFCGSATKALQSARHELRISQSVEHLRVKLNLAEPPRIPEGTGIACVSVDVEANGAVGKAWCLMPEAMAGAL
ncbi:hypothetical protein [Engelhardtia mirabilis]|uniref:Chemotaxis phosphatase CheX-like domain-containing protein n=1 Tax=Engelhardtia mirabilis TaxID=2528011 RepID=A0A518BSD7_9BACT|nr:hypothetical protein Pla133_49980 [Planctomycetes bacterium Pla133]QDV04201.1 hypothetical protein Pla86_49960 [Planctomycetes bacterium Pla86]